MSICQDVCQDVWMFAPSGGFFLGLSLALWSHGQIQSSNWSYLLPSLLPPTPKFFGTPNSNKKKNLGPFPQKMLIPLNKIYIYLKKVHGNGDTIRIGQEI